MPFYTKGTLKLYKEGFLDMGQYDNFSEHEAILKEKNPVKIQKYLEAISLICRQNKWYASAVYANSAAEALFHMTYLGDKAQKPVHFISITDIHYSAYPDSPDDECCN